jgi:two-component system phosphate regulon response regulator PhoB
MNPRVLIVEDEQALNLLLRYNLESEGFDVEIVERGDDAETRIRENQPDLLILDWMLPGVSGIEICRRLRARPETKQLPILMLTARGEETERIRGLATGADDYVVKPFSLPELLARVHALLRRAYPSEEKKQLSFPPFEIDIQRGEVRKDGSRIELTPKEFELTVTLFRNIGRLLSRGHLQETVWGRTGDLATRTVDTHVSQVRKKLDLRPESGYRVVPIYNYGYRLEKIFSAP